MGGGGFFVLFLFFFVFMLCVRYYASYYMAALKSDLPCGIIRAWATKSVLLLLELRVCRLLCCL